MCFKCGRIGHGAASCKPREEKETLEEGQVRKETEGEDGTKTKRSPVIPAVQGTVENREDYGPWMLVRGKKHSARPKLEGKGYSKGVQPMSNLEDKQEQGRGQGKQSNKEEIFKFRESCRGEGNGKQCSPKGPFNFMVKGPSKGQGNLEMTGLPVKPIVGIKVNPRVDSLSYTHDQHTSSIPNSPLNPNQKITSRRKNGRRKTQSSRDRSSDACILDSWFGGAKSESKLSKEDPGPGDPLLQNENSAIESYANMQERGDTPALEPSGGAPIVEGKIIIDLTQCGVGSQNLAGGNGGRGSREEETRGTSYVRVEPNLRLVEQGKPPGLGELQDKGPYEDSQGSQTNMLVVSKLGTVAGIQPLPKSAGEDKPDRNTREVLSGDKGAAPLGCTGEEDASASMDWRGPRESAEGNRE